MTIAKPGCVSGLSMSRCRQSFKNWGEHHFLKLRVNRFALQSLQAEALGFAFIACANCRRSVWFDSSECTWADSINKGSDRRERGKVLPAWQLLCTAPLYRFFLLKVVKEDFSLSSITSKALIFPTCESLLWPMISSFCLFLAAATKTNGSK